MGDIAMNFADVVLITDDDPDTENRLKILNDMTRNLQTVFIPDEKELFIIPERRYAIKLATEIARPGDVVVLAGKGHELVQLTNFGKRNWSDKQVLIEILQSQGKQILATAAIKQRFLEELKHQHNPSHLTPETYYSGVPSVLGRGVGGGVDGRVNDGRVSVDGGRDVGGRPNGVSLQEKPMVSGMFKPIG
jgi:hypothetical protein